MMHKEMRSSDPARNSGHNVCLSERGVDARAAIRYELCALVVFTWTDSTGEVREKRGCTRDISPKGAFVVSPFCPPKGTALEMSIYLSLTSEDSRDIRIEVQGSVQRVEAETKLQEQGFSVQSHCMRYVRSG